MKKSVFGMVVGALLAFGSPALATPANVVDLYNSCHADGAAEAALPECVLLQENITAAVQDCMASPESKSDGAKSAHGYKARYLICQASARQQFGTVGH